LERQLLKAAAAASSAARVREQKAVGVAIYGKKVTPLWNQVVKDTIRAKKKAYNSQGLASEQTRTFFVFAGHRSTNVPSTHGGKI